MTDTVNLLAYVAVMSIVTYLTRMIPLLFFTREIKSSFVKSFLFYVPYAVLGAMTVPAIFFSSGSIISASFGFITAVLLSIKKCGLLTVAAFSCAAVFVAEFILSNMGLISF